MIRILFLLVILMYGCISTYKNVDNLTPKQFDYAIQTIDDALLVDVRTTKEYKQGAINDAVLVDVKQESLFKQYFNSINKERPILLYCRSGKRSELAKNILNQMGFTNVKDLDGGYQLWEKHKNKKGSN